VALTVSAYGLYRGWAGTPGKAHTRFHCAGKLPPPSGVPNRRLENTAKIVLERGGEVLRTPKRGVGRAYLDAIPYIRGKWILMGDVWHRDNSVDWDQTCIS
jgi:hypothetical protein